MSREVVFDIETMGDIKDLTTMRITVVSLYDYSKDAYFSFEEKDLGNAWPFFEHAERIIGFNSEHFDLPIIHKYYPGSLAQIPHLDILKLVKETTGRRYKLDDLAQATLQTQKSADGLQAMKWFQEGKIDDIKKYCEQDVRITKELYEFGRKNKMIYYPLLTGEIIPIAVNFEPHVASNAGGAGINLTLPL